MARSDLAGDGQSEARTVLVAPAPPEAGHRPGEVLVRQPGTVVADGQLHRGVRGSGRDGDRRVFPAVPQRVVQRDVEQLLYVMAREWHREPGMVRAVTQLLVLVIGDGLPECDALLDHVVQIRRIGDSGRQSDSAAA